MNLPPNLLATLIYIILFLGVLFLIARIFHLHLIFAILKGGKFEFKTHAGLVSFAAFLLPFVLLLHEQSMSFFKAVLQLTAYEPIKVDVSFYQILIFSLSWLTVNFVILALARDKTP